MKSDARVERYQLSGTEAQIAGVHPVIERLVQHRGIKSADEIESSLSCLLPPDGLGGITAAVEIIHRALQQDHHILIIGDYDADGATSTAVAIRALK